MESYWLNIHIIEDCLNRAIGFDETDRREVIVKAREQNEYIFYNILEFDGFDFDDDF